MERIAGRFARIEPRRRAARLVLGLLSDLPRKNCWTIAEWAGEATPHGMQHLLCRASWDADAVRDDVREYVVDHLHDDSAVLVVDETGDVKKGPHAGELAYYCCHATVSVPLSALVKVAGSRWASGGDLSGREGPGRARRAPGPPLPLLKPLGHPRHARPRLPRRRPRRRTHQPARSGRPHPPYLQRDPAPVPLRRGPAPPQPHPPTRPVRLATPPPGTITDQPLPTTSHSPDMKITIYSWSIRRGSARAGPVTEAQATL